MIDTATLYLPNASPLPKGMGEVLHFGMTVFLSARGSVEELRVIGYDGAAREILAMRDNGVRTRFPADMPVHGDRRTAEEALKEKKRRKRAPGK